MLESLFRPKSAAVIGASSKELSIGNRVIKNLIDFGFKGEIYPINPKADEIRGIKAYKSIMDCPDGIDVYFENVGGAVFAAVLTLLNRNSRASLCGLLSQYGNTDGGDMLAQWFETGRPIFEERGVTAHKLFVGDFVNDHQSAFLETMSQWLRAGQVQYREHITEGLANAPDAYADMLSGASFGKSLVAVSPDPTK